MCSGAIGITYTSDETPWNYFCFTFFLGGVFATRLWSALLSLELVILLTFGPNFTMFRWLLTLMAGWGLVVAVCVSNHLDGGMKVGWRPCQITTNIL